MTNSKAYSAFFAKGREILPADAFLTSADDCAAYATDWSRLPGNPSGVVLPRTTEEVSRILKLCDEYHVPVVPSGGRTGLCGGACATSGEIVLSLSRMNRLYPVDTLSGTLRVQTGATTQGVHEHCAPHGLIWPIDLASKGSSQIGGNLSTNAGGVRVIRYGMARKWVLGIEAVTAQGKIIHLNESLEKNNTGYDLMQLILGSEGTLVVVTEATLKLTRLPEKTLVLFFALPDLKALFSLLEAARRGPFDLLAFEFFSSQCLDAVESVLERRSRLSVKAPYYALLEAEIFSSESREKIDSWLEKNLNQGLWNDGCLAESAFDKAAVWGLREGITESLSRLGRVRKYDVSVPVNRLLDFLKDVQRIHLEMRQNLQLYLFGHLGDGSPHLNLVGPVEQEPAQFEEEADQFEKALFPLLKSFGGSVSAEHGIGLLKKKWLTYSRSQEELSWYRSIKKVFDPKGILNPGKVID